MWCVVWHNQMSKSDNYLLRFQAFAGPFELCPCDESVAVRVHCLEGLLNLSLLSNFVRIVSVFLQRGKNCAISNSLELMPWLVPQILSWWIILMYFSKVIESQNYKTINFIWIPAHGVINASHWAIWDRNFVHWQEYLVLSLIFQLR